MILALNPRSGMRGMGARPRVQIFVPYQPYPNVLPPAPVMVRGVRGLGAGVVHTYCNSNPPDSTTVAEITAMGDSVSMVNCPYSTGQPGITSGASSQNTPIATGPVGPQPVFQPPAPPNYANCDPGTLGPAGSTACVSSNTQLQSAWQTAYLQAENAFNNAMCRWNGNPQSYCDQIYVPGAAQNMAVQTPVPLPGGSSSGPPPSGSTIITLTDVTSQVVNPSQVKVGDAWRVMIYGAPINSPVTAMVSGPQSATFQAGVTDGNGNFQTTGVWDSSQVGSWTESWSVGGKPVGGFSFTVVGPPAAPSGGSGAPGGSTPPPSGAGGTTPPSGSLVTSPSGGAVITNLTGGSGSTSGLNISSSVGGIPMWGILAGAGALILVLVVASSKS